MRNINRHRNIKIMTGVNVLKLKTRISTEHGKSFIGNLESTCKEMTTLLYKAGYQAEIITKLAPRDFTEEGILIFRIINNNVDKLLDPSFELKLSNNNTLYLVTILGAIKLAQLNKGDDISYIINNILKDFYFQPIGNNKNFIANADIHGNSLPDKMTYPSNLSEEEKSTLSAAAKHLKTVIFGEIDISLAIPGGLGNSISYVFESEKFDGSKIDEARAKQIVEEAKTEQLTTKAEEKLDYKKLEAKENKPNKGNNKEDINLEDSSSWIDWAYSQATPKNALIAGGTLAIGFAGYKGLQLPSPASSTAIVEHAAANSPLRNLVAAVTNSPLVKQVAVVGFTETYTSPGGGFDRDDMHPTTPNYSSDNGEEIDTPGANELIKTVMKTATKLHQKTASKNIISQAVNDLISHIDHKENSWLQGKQAELRSLLIRFMNENTKAMSKDRIYNELLENYRKDQVLNQDEFESALSSRRTKEPGKCKALGLDKLCKNLDIAPKTLLNDILNTAQENQYILYLAMMLGIPLTQAAKITSEELNHNSTAWDALSGIDDLDEDITDNQDNQTASAESEPVLLFTEADNSWSAQIVDGLVTFVPTIISYALLGQSLQVDYVQALTQNIDPVNMYLINGLIVQKSSEGLANAYNFASYTVDTMVHQYIGAPAEEAQ